MDRLRAIADTRPGYATYPDTRPGSPYWQRTRQPGPCTWAHRPGTGLICVRSDHQHQERIAGTGDPLPPLPDCAYPADAVPLPPPVRRRWWHRITRRARP